MTRGYRLVLGVLAVWRATYLLWAEDGPWDLGVRLRRRAGAGMAGRLLDCFYCLSLWVAAPLAVLLGRGRLERALLWPALSAGAILLERLCGGPAPPPALYYEDTPADPDDPEAEDGVLRTATATGGHGDAGPTSA